MKNDYRWHDNETDPPKESGTYLTWHDGYYNVLDFNAEWGLWNARVTKDTAIYTVVAWRPLPKHPVKKEEEENA